jgi:MFS family permease
MKWFKKVTAHPLILPLYLPAVLFSIAEGLLIPTLPIYAGKLGFSYGLIGFIIAGESLGALIADLPSGLLLRRVNEKNAMLLGLGLVAASTVALFWAQSLPQVLICRLLAGFGASFYNVSRLTYIAEVVPLVQRGRVNATFGGLKRVGAFSGPMIAGFVATAHGLQTPFLIYAAICLVAIVVVMIWVEPSQRLSIEGLPSIGVNHLTSMVHSHARVLLTAGLGNFFVLMIRTIPGVIIPLFSADILGLDIKSIGIILGVSAAIDVMLFYPAGFIMDHFGRKPAIISSMLIFMVGLAILPLARDIWSLLGIGMLIGFGNGLGSGSMLTLGADFSPKENRGEFLGLWMLIGNLGSTTGPLVAGAVASIFLLQTATLVFSGGCILAIMIFAFLVPETLKKPERTLPVSPE